jgi:hypothetical protein
MAFLKTKCKCGHTLNDHDYKVKEGTILYGGCVECQCQSFERKGEPKKKKTRRTNDGQKNRSIRRRTRGMKR